VRLLTIPISHYCEKARWALDRAGIAYEEERHIQGVHQIVARRAGGGTTVPVLLTGDRVLTESAAILRYADDRMAPERRLFPHDAAERREVETLGRELDEGLGPDARRLIYAVMFEAKPLMLHFNNQGVPRWEARALTALWPLATRYVSRHLGITAATRVEDERRVRATFDAIAERLADGRRHLCGDRFSAADLTFACLSSAVIAPPQYGVRLPQPEELPQHIGDLIRSFREHAAGAYAMELFRTERNRPDLA
jgi:glutathione S-transferase